MTFTRGEEFTEIFPSPDMTTTAVQPFPALSDALRPSVRTPPGTAYELPLWRSETPSRVPLGQREQYGFRDVLAALANEAEPFATQFRNALTLVLGRRLMRHEATPLEVLEIIQGLV